MKGKKSYKKLNKHSIIKYIQDVHAVKEHKNVYTLQKYIV